ncbi:MAG: SMC-Scp complex subunit ScpB [Candidatus Taylorbacteria bacterium]
MNLDAQIEAILFFKGEPVTLFWLAKTLAKEEKEVEVAILELERKLEGRGLVLMRKENEVMLGTAPAFSSLIERLTKEELSRDLGRAGLETLSIIMYRGPLPRREIDYIRGVNSNFILRNLLIRGLVEKINSPDDERVFLYKPTFELLQFMGLSKIEDLPEYQSVRKTIEELKMNAEQENKESDAT